MVATFAPACVTETYFRHLPDAGWQTSSRSAAADAIYFDYEVDKPWKGCPATAEAIVCVEMVK